MDFNHLFDSLPADGWLSKNEAKFLWGLITVPTQTGAILEVGCYMGRSTVLLAAAGRPVYSVDPFDGFSDTLTSDQVEARWRDNIISRKINNVTLYRMPIEEWEPQPITFAYLDGDHTYVGTVDQIKVARRCRASVIAIHDVNDSGGGLEVKRGAVETLGSWDDRVGRLAMWSL